MATFLLQVTSINNHKRVTKTKSWIYISIKTTDTVVAIHSDRFGGNVDYITYLAILINHYCTVQHASSHSSPKQRRVVLRNSNIVISDCFYYDSDHDAL